MNCCSEVSGVRNSCETAETKSDWSRCDVEFVRNATGDDDRAGEHDDEDEGEPSEHDPPSRTASVEITGARLVGEDERPWEARVGGRPAQGGRSRCRRGARDLGVGIHEGHVKEANRRE